MIRLPSRSADDSRTAWAFAAAGCLPHWGIGKISSRVIASASARWHFFWLVKSESGTRSNPRGERLGFFFERIDQTMTTHQASGVHLIGDFANCKAGPRMTDAQALEQFCVQAVRDSG